MDKSICISNINEYIVNTKKEIETEKGANGANDTSSTCKYIKTEPIDIPQNKITQKNRYIKLCCDDFKS